MHLGAKSSEKEDGIGWQEYIIACGFVHPAVLLFVYTVNGQFALYFESQKNFARSCYAILCRSLPIYRVYISI